MITADGIALGAIAGESARHRSRREQVTPWPVALSVRRSGVLVAVAVLLLAASSARAEGLLERVLRILGMSAAPGQMKGPDSDAGPGRIWIADLKDGSRRALTSDGGYRWPIFEIGGTTVVALRANKVVRISLQGGKVEQLREARGVEKLVGFDAAKANEVLVVRRSESAPLAMLSLKTGKLTSLPYDRKSKDQNQLIAYARGETRVYGNARLFLQTEARAAMEGTREWQNVYIQEGQAPPRPVSRCQDVACHQPSLSPNGAWVAYVQSDTPGG